MTKDAFLTAYRAHLTATHAWAQDRTRLHIFMDAVANTLNGPAATWNHDGDAVRAAWRDIGGKGKPTLKALRALA